MLRSPMVSLLDGVELIENQQMFRELTRVLAWMCFWSHWRRYYQPDR